VLFLLGFGFNGYVFHNTAHLLLPITLILAVLGGVVLALLLLMLISRIFGGTDVNTEQDVSDRTGLLGKVSVPIPENNLGEIIYTSPGGMRKSIPARSTDGRRLERNQEVVVVNYQHGVAEVDTWERFMNEEEALDPKSPLANEDELAKLRALLEESDPRESKLALQNDLQKE
jgi:membrane protein implicated in regulation of membrane protease activity